MRINGSRRFLGAALVAAIAVGSSGGAAMADDPMRQVERARGVWAVQTSLGPARYEIEAHRATRPGREPVTTGFIGTRVCLEGGICIASADLKRVHDDRLEVDPSLSSATLSMWFAGERHSAVWDASGGMPEIATDGLLEGDASIERGAAADGTAFGMSLSQDAVRDAFVERGASAGDADPDPPPLPQTLPGFGPSSSVAATECWTWRPKERGFTRAMNEEREGRNLGRIRLDPELSKAARVHTRDMIRTNLLHHTSSTTLRRRVTNWTVLGENVGVGGTVGSLHAAFMASPAHKDNILYSRFKHVGVGTATAAGQLWVTVIFEATDNPGTRLRMPRC